MTTMQFTCDTVAAHLAEHLEGDATATVSAAIAAHSAGCTACGALLADVAFIEREASRMPALAPGRDLWSGIAERIEARVLPMSSAAARAPSAATTPNARRWWTHPAIAAAALVAITAGLTHYATLRTVDDTVTRVASGTPAAPVLDVVGAVIDAAQPFRVTAESAPLVNRAGDSADDAGMGPSTRATGLQSIAASTPRGIGVAANATRATTNVVAASYRPGDIAALDSLYYREIVRLRTVLGERRTELSPSTVDVIDRNMLVIDRAIQECRAALAADPASTFLNEQLNEALETKIELLRTAAMMPVGA